MKILLCFGTRPEAIKMAPVIHELKRQKLDFKVCVTAQHREMLDQVIEYFEITPDDDLNIMQPDQSLNQLSANILNEIDLILEREQPHLVLVQGDTTTAAIVSLAAFHRGIKVGHVEAGLRTYNKSSPFPEEINRQLISKVADWHFVPTSRAKSNLTAEQILEEHIYLTGNTVVDALNWAIAKMESKPLSEEIKKINSIIKPGSNLILVTGHRRENFGEGLNNICKALLELSGKDNVEIIFPVHLNPKVSGPVQELLGQQNNIHLIAPVSYPVMLWLMQRCNLIISDSGGIQEEAPSFKKAVLVTREMSERMEGVEAGFALLVGTDRTRIVNEAVRILNHPPDYSGIENPFGDGNASLKIVEVLKKEFSKCV